MRSHGLPKAKPVRRTRFHLCAPSPAEGFDVARGAIPTVSVGTPSAQITPRAEPVCRTRFHLCTPLPMAKP